MYTYRSRLYTWVILVLCSLKWQDSWRLDDNNPTGMTRQLVIIFFTNERQAQQQTPWWFYATEVHEDNFYMYLIKHTCASRVILAKYEESYVLFFCRDSHYKKLLCNSRNGMCCNTDKPCLTKRNSLRSCMLINHSRHFNNIAHQLVASRTIKIPINKIGFMTDHKILCLAE